MRGRPVSSVDVNYSTSTRSAESHQLITIIVQSGHCSIIAESGDRNFPACPIRTFPTPRARAPTHIMQISAHVVHQVRRPDSERALRICLCVPRPTSHPLQLPQKELGHNIRKFHDKLQGRFSNFVTAAAHGYVELTTLHSNLMGRANKKLPSTTYSSRSLTYFDDVSRKKRGEKEP